MLLNNMVKLDFILTNLCSLLALMEHFSKIYM